MMEEIQCFNLKYIVVLTLWRVDLAGGVGVGRVRLETSTLGVSPCHSSRTLGYLFNLSDVVPSAT